MQTPSVKPRQQQTDPKNLSDILEWAADEHLRFRLAALGSQAAAKNVIDGRGKVYGAQALKHLRLLQALLRQADSLITAKLVRAIRRGHVQPHPDEIVEERQTSLHLPTLPDA